MSKRVTISDVARSAGVSATAVSFAFNHPDELNPQTVERILETARALGYAPSPFARALLRRRAGVIGVLVPQPLPAILENPFFSMFLAGVATTCHAHELSMLVTGAPDSTTLGDPIAQAPVDGFIVVGVDEDHHEVQPLQRRGVPFVLVDGEAQTASSLNIDDVGGAYSALSYLLGRGHRDIVILTFETPYAHLDDVLHGAGGGRRHGFMRAAQEAGVEWREDWFVPCITSVAGGDQAFRSLWAAGSRPTAIQSVSDVVAIGAIRAAQRVGVRVPDDLEVIGFDDIPLASLVTPTLSTVRQPVFERGALAAEMLVRELGGSQPGERVQLPTELVLRGSTRGSMTKVR
jgi:DNA-binding LacI/PurR family transcriptional regulator